MTRINLDYEKTVIAETDSNHKLPETGEIILKNSISTRFIHFTGPYCSNFRLSRPGDSKFCRHPHRSKTARGHRPDTPSRSKKGNNTNLRSNPTKTLIITCIPNSLGFQTNEFSLPAITHWNSMPDLPVFGPTRSFHAQRWLFNIESAS